MKLEENNQFDKIGEKNNSMKSEENQFDEIGGKNQFDEIGGKIFIR